MKKDKKYYLSLNYPVQIEKVQGGYCAYITMLKGCKAFGASPEIALKELEAVKEGFFDVFMEMGKPIPKPVIHLDIPYDIFRGLSHREELDPFVVY
ncbi:MAG: type II toxin-antitoxin system HicB family antitoxin [Deltaproteobacteria bacterium]|nr:type II toxin-antitoxin system HicB family antitoxin [Deltaproteobacteria bacterium]MBW2119022.1 type II toxin-antitoxin system HicB family antitoxin [Deltaproteobacteria bacterium]